jgi:hypothetical protein
MHIKHFVFVILTSLLPTFVLAQLQLEPAFPNLTFTRPVDLQHSNDGSNRLYVVDKQE